MYKYFFYLMKTSALLLCSGTSSRMNPFENKFLFEFNGKSLLRHQLENILLQKNIEEIFIICNSKNISIIKKQIDTFFSSEQKNITCVLQEKVYEGMKGGVLSVEKSWKTKNAILIISSNDMLENWFLSDFLQEESYSQIDGKICGKTVEKYFPGGYLELDSEKNVKTIIEKPGEGNEPSNMINLVFHWFKNSQQVFSILKSRDNSNDDAYEQMIQELINEGNKIKAFEYKGKWQSLKYPWHILDMKDFFCSSIKKQHISKDAFISKNAVINGNVIIESGVKIFDFSVIQGPCYIGKNTIIGNNSLVRESYIGENSCIGQGSEIARSYLRNNVFTHQSYIGDSVVDNNVNFGAGCRTGNLRHDSGEVGVLVKNEIINSGKNKLGIFCGANGKFGVNTSFSPGVTIGKNCWSYPQVIFSTNIKENSFIKQKKENLEYDIRENKNK